MSPCLPSAEPPSTPASFPVVLIQSCLGRGQCQTLQGRAVGNMAAGSYEPTCSDVSFCLNSCQAGLACILEQDGLDFLSFYSISCSSGCSFLSIETSDPFMLPAKLLASLMTMISICALSQIISRLLLLSVWVHGDLSSRFANERKGLLGRLLQLLLPRKLHKAQLPGPGQCRQVLLCFLPASQAELLGCSDQGEDLRNEERKGRCPEFTYSRQPQF